MTTESIIATTNSSNVQSFGYVPARSVLFVEFKGGARYEYDKVPPEIFEELKQANDNAESIGSFLSRRVKGYYDARKVEG